MFFFFQQAKTLILMIKQEGANYFGSAYILADLYEKRTKRVTKSSDETILQKYFFFFFFRERAVLY